MNYYSNVENTICTPLKQSLKINEMIFRAGFGQYTTLYEAGVYCLYFRINQFSGSQIFTYNSNTFNLTQIQNSKVFILTSFNVSI